MSTEATIRPSTSLWRNRDYLLLASGQCVSANGSQVSQLAFPLLILALTNSPALAGLAGAIRLLPYILLSLPAGALIDRWDRKHVMILCDTGRAISLASIPIAFALGHLTIVQLYLVTLIEGILFVFFNLAEVACLPQVVTKEQLPTATTQASIIYNQSFVLGPPLGGLLFSLGRFVPFLADALSYLASVISLLFIKTPFQEQRTTTPRKLRVEISEGLLWLWRQPIVRFTTLLATVLQFIAFGMILMLIVLAHQQHAAPFVTGLLVTCAGMGAVVGAILGGLLQKRFSFSLLILSGIGACGLLWPLYATMPNLILLGLIAAGLGTSIGMQDVVQFTYRLALIPDSMQGRVNSIFRLIAFSGNPLSTALMGILLQTIGVMPTVWLYESVFIVVVLAALLNPQVYNARPIAEVKAAR